MISFFNVKTGETRKIATSPDDMVALGREADDFDGQFIEPQIAALYNSGNLHVNATHGQDFGWRLAPELVGQLRTIRADDDLVGKIAGRFQIPQENLEDSNILLWICQEDARKARQANVDETEKHTREYEEEIRKLDAQDEESEDDDDAPTKPKKTPKQTAAQKKAQQKLVADQKRREANIAAGRDLNDGIDGAKSEDDDDGLEDEDEPQE